VLPSSLPCVHPFRPVAVELMLDGPSKATGSLG
jgi:hypothetical protein